MRFIDKSESPSFFEEEKVGFPLTESSSWKDLQNPCKTYLKEFLTTEQSGLCAYCECDLSSTKSHLEHIKPRSLYNNLKFEYTNLVVSCNGVFLCETDPQLGRTCGHKKENEYDEDLFLNPIELLGIGSYFIYDAETGAILPSEAVSTDSAKYMISLLHLDIPYLRDARKNAKDAIVELLSTPEYKDSIFEIIEKELSVEREYISYLRYCFK